LEPDSTNLDFQERDFVWRELEAGSLDTPGVIARLKFLAQDPQESDLPRTALWVTSEDWQVVAAAVSLLRSLVTRGVADAGYVFEAMPEGALARVGQWMAQDGAISVSEFSALLNRDSRAARLGALAALSAFQKADNEVLVKLRALIPSQDKDETALAAIALARLGDRAPETRSLLIRQLERSEAAPRHLCVLALLELAPPEWEELPILSRALQDAPPELWSALQVIMEDYALPVEDLMMAGDPTA
jgi:hypothetical protein